MLKHCIKCFRKILKKIRVWVHEKQEFLIHETLHLRSQKHMRKGKKVV